MRIRILLPLTATALAGSVALYAIHREAPMNRHTVYASYTTTDILEFLAFSAGRVVADQGSDSILPRSLPPL